MDESKANKYLTRSRDVDTYLLSQLGDKELLNVLLLNKDFLKIGSSFFEKRLKERYPLLLKFKPKKMNYTKYYLSIVYYIAKLKEEYDLDYVPAPSFNPKIYYYKLIHQYDNTYSYYRYIGETGDINLIKQYDEMIETDSLMQGAIQSGNVDAVKYLESKGHSINQLRYVIDAVSSQNEDMQYYILNRLSLVFPEDEIYIETIYGLASLNNLEGIKYYEKLIEPNTHYQQILAVISNIDIFKYFLHKFESEIENEELDIEEYTAEMKDAVYHGVVENRLDILKYIIINYPNMVADIELFAKLFHQDDVLDLLDMYL